MATTTRHGRRGVRLFLAVILLLVLARVFGGRTVATPPAFENALTLTGAREASQRTGMPVLVFATADWCGPCQTLKKGALADDTNQKWITENTHPVLLDVTNPDNPEAALLQVTTIPVLIMLRNGAEPARLHGVVDAKELHAWLAEHSGAVADFKHRQVGQDVGENTPSPTDEAPAPPATQPEPFNPPGPVSPPGG
jgi:thiol:disulfide interchange protein